MDTASLKSFATRARIELIKEVGARIATVLAPGSSGRVEESAAIKALEAAIRLAGGEAAGRAKVADRVAYTWFNRIIALRFMDANGYTGIGVVSPNRGEATGQPEVLADAKRGVIDTEVVTKHSAERIAALLDGSRRSADPQGEAYSLLLAEYCRHWHRSMPFMFEREGDYTELLIPANLLADDSVLARSVSVLTEAACQDVEVIGWLYQFYISERKEEVFAGFKKNKKAGADEIPAATQLFTPHWIVRYLVENSVGRLWTLNHPDSLLVDQMDFYIAPVDEETDFLKISKPEDLSVIDPACGSGHMLTYAFDLLYAIYEEQGYAPSEIPSLILKHNLYGTEIDPRAGALAAFALTMKARARQRTFFNKQVAPNICVLDPISFSPDELDYLVTSDGDHHAEGAFWNQFVEADTFGSLIRPDPVLTVELARHLATLDDEGDMLRADTLAWAQRVIDQAEYLARRYHIAIANPPYMGGKQMNALLSQFMKDEYPDSKSDLFAGFIERCTDLALSRGATAMITMQSWMFLSSYEKLRASLLARQRITSMLHLGARAFDSIGGEVVSATAFVLTNLPSEVPGSCYKRAGAFVRLVDWTSEAEKATALSTAISVRSQDAGYYLASGEDFAAIPGSPIVYWLSEKMRAAFVKAGDGNSVGDVCGIAQGITTGDNGRFLRLWWEVSREESEFNRDHESRMPTRTWQAADKGGDFRRWFGNNDRVIFWPDDGREIVEFPGSTPRNIHTRFRPSIACTKISSGGISFRAHDHGFVFTDASVAATRAGDLDSVLGFVNSSSANQMMAALAPTLNFEVGQIRSVPWLVDRDGEKALGSTVAQLKSNSAADWNSFEASWDFASNPLIALAQESLRPTIGHRAG